MKRLPQELTLIIPTYKEAIPVVEETLTAVEKVLFQTNWKFEIIIINDGSGPEFDYKALQTKAHVRILEHPHNKGYGAAIKTGIQHSTHPWIGITDADGTYPHQDFPQLLEKTEEADMFFKLVGRLGLYFNPLRISPIAEGCITVGLLKAIRDYIVEGHLGNVSTSLILASLQIYLMSLLAELISKKSYHS